MELNKPNVIVIVIDSLRKDYAKPLNEILMKYGFISYDRCIAPASWTIPSHASIFTGLYPAFHGIHATHEKKIPYIRFRKFNNNLQSELKRRGYKTYLFSANIWIAPYFGLDDFDIFEDIWLMPCISVLSEKEKRYVQSIRSRLREKNKKYLRIRLALELLKNKKFKLFAKKTYEFLLRWSRVYSLGLIRKWPKEKGVSLFLKRLKNVDWSSKPLFIFVNLMEVHEPYDFQDRGGLQYTLRGLVTPQLINLWKNRYSEFANYVFKKIDYFLKTLNKDVFEESLIIITSDHGQLLGENNRLGHGVFLDNELLFVPLFIKYPSGWDVVEKNYQNREYISLVNLKKFILGIVDNNQYSSLLYSSHVLAESFGVHYSFEYFSKSEWERISVWDKYRIALFWDEFKAVFNVSDWVLEKIEPLSPNAILSEEKRRIIKKIITSHLYEVARLKKIKVKKIKQRGERNAV